MIAVPKFEFHNHFAVPDCAPEMLRLVNEMSPTTILANFQLTYEVVIDLVHPSHDAKKLDVVIPLVFQPV